MSEPHADPPRRQRPSRSPFSIRIGRFFGIDVIVHWAFWLLIPFAALIVATTPQVGWDHFPYYLLLIFAVFGCVVLHEFGHALTARRFGVQTRDVTLLPIGGVARLQRMPEKPIEELLVAIAGPAVNVVIAGVLIPLYLLVVDEPKVADFFFPEGNFIAELAMINLFLVAFNALPAFPMDGGRVLRALLSIRMGRVNATRTAAVVGQTLAVVFFVGGLFLLGSIILALIGVFVFFGARAEAHAVAMQAAFAGLRVDAAMMTDFEHLTHDVPLGQAADELLAGSQHEFPVIDGDGRMAGILTRETLIQGVERFGSDAPVSRAMRPSRLVVPRDMPLRAAIEQMQAAEAPIAPVIEDERVVGLLSLENAGEFAALRQASARRRRA